MKTDASSLAPSAISYDVWGNIASFLPSKTLQGLYSVNQALFNLSMDERYRSLHLISPGDPSTRNLLRRLREDQFRIRRVRQLFLSIRDFGFFPGLDTFDWRSSLSKNGLDAVYYSLSQKQKKKSRSKKANKLSSEAEAALIMLQETLDVVRSIPGLQSCTIHGSFPAPGHGSSYGIAFPLVLAAWSAAKSTVRSLELEVPVEVLSDILPSGLAFDGLEHFGLNLNVTYRSTDAMEMLFSTIVPFISHHRSTFRSFALRTHEHLHLTPLFKRLPSMPLLRDLEVSAGYVSTLQTDTSGLHDFLTRHAEQLKGLTLLFYGLGLHLVRDPFMEDWLKQPCLRVSYPSLNKLSIGLHNFPEDFGEKIQQSLHGFWNPNLRHLKLPMVLKTDQVEVVLSNIPDDVKLVSFSLAVDSLNPALFDVLSARLPRLVDLEVDVTSGKLTGLRTTQADDDDSGSESEERMAAAIAEIEKGQHEFTSEMQSREYPHWFMRNLILSLGSSNVVIPTGVKSAISAALPKLQILQVQYESNVLEGSHHQYNFNTL